MSETKTSVVREAVWPWRAEERPGAASAQARALRRAGLGQAGGLAVTGAVVRLVAGHATAALAIWGLALAWLGVALWRPAWCAPPRRWAVATGRIAGHALAWLALVPLFVLVFVPAGLVLRLRRADPLLRRRGATAAWVPRRRDPARTDYRRQYLYEEWR